MSALDEKLYYIPHPGVKPVLLPELPPPVKSSPSIRNKEGLRNWVDGPSPIQAWTFDPGDNYSAYEKRWQMKCDYFEQCFPEDILESVERMSAADMKARGVWLENELKRIEDALAAMYLPVNDLEIGAGVQLINLLMHEAMGPLWNLESLENSESDDQVLNTFKEKLQKVERTYGFLQQSFEKIESLLRNYPALPSVKPVLEHPDTHWKDPDFIRDVESRRVRVSAPGSISSTTSRSAGNHEKLELSGPSDYTAVDDQRRIAAEGPPATVDERTLKHPSTQKDSDFTDNSESRRVRVSAPATSRSAGNHAELESSGPSDYTAADDHSRMAAEQPPAAVDERTARLSAVSSHRTNLAALLAIAFFGASVAWSTLFSGARGNFEIISWAASVFIVGCTAAASASLLMETDELFMTRHIQVRWTVRIFTLVSAAHVLAGLILVSTAIAVLNPNVSKPFSGSRYVMKAAGWYAVGMAMSLVITMIMVRRRYGYRTWFRGNSDQDLGEFERDLLRL